MPGRRRLCGVVRGCPPDGRDPGSDCGPRSGSSEMRALERSQRTGASSEGAERALGRPRSTTSDPAALHAKPACSLPSLPGFRNHLRRASSFQSHRARRFCLVGTRRTPQLRLADRRQHPRPTVPAYRLLRTRLRQGAHLWLACPGPQNPPPGRRIQRHIVSDHGLGGGRVLEHNLAGYLDLDGPPEQGRMVGQ